MMTSSMSSSPISITVSGNEFETLEKISNDIIDKISKVEGAIDIKLNNEKSSQEINIKVDKQKAAKYGITNSMVAQIVNQRIQSSKITSFTVEGKTFDVTSFTDSTNQPTLYDLDNINIYTQTGQKVALSDIATYF